MRMTSVRLFVAFLSLAALPLGCAESPSSPPKGSGGSGGSSNRTGGSGGNSSGGSGGSSATGGSGGASAATGGGSGGGSTATGGSSGAGGDATGGSSGGTGGGGTTDATGGHSGTGGDATGGGGGTSTGFGGGTSLGDAGTEATGGKGDTQGGSGGETGGDSGADTTGGSDASDGPAAGTCTDNVQSDTETDVDCGGGTCGKCGSGLKCKADGDCRTGTCASGKCADGFAATAPVTHNNGSNIWTIALGTVIFEVDASAAGKVYTFSIDGTDVVAKNIAATGSEFWTSPQSGWYTNGNTWPPPNEMTNSAYTPISSNNVLTMTGPAWGGGLSITKRFWGNTDNKAITLEYTIKNGTSAEVSNAPWEITRVYAGGLSFFPNADTWVQLGDPNARFGLPPVTSSQGVTWFDDSAASYRLNNTNGVKGGADGLEGWAAHVVCGTGLKKTCATGAASPILIKQWADTPVSNNTVNPTEREVEFYVDADNSYEEFEQQGLFQPIPAGSTLVWTMHWLLRYLPSAVAPKPDSVELLTWVRGQLL